MRVRRMMVGLALVTADRLVAQSTQPLQDTTEKSPYSNRAFCVVRADTTIPWMSAGYAFRGSSRSRGGRIISRAYPVVTEVIPNSAADSAGLLVGDEIVASYGFDQSREWDSIAAHRPKGPGIPIPMKVRRGLATIDVTLIPRRGDPPSNCTPASFLRDSIAKARARTP